MTILELCVNNFKSNQIKYLLSPKQQIDYNNNSAMINTLAGGQGGSRVFTLFSRGPGMVSLVFCLEKGGLNLCFFKDYFNINPQSG